MGEIASKIANVVADPLLLTFMATVIALLSLLVGLWRLGWLALGFASLWLAVILFTPLPNLVMLPLEQRFERPELPDNVDGIIVLGGAVNPEVSLYRGEPHFNDASERLYQAAVLARKFPQAKLVYTSASFEYQGTPIPGGPIAERYFTSLGIDATRIITQNESVNTRDDVVLSKALLKPRPDETWIVVTSAFHMPRTMALFRANEWNVLPWPADYKTSGPRSLNDFGPNPLSNLITMTAALHEWVGLAGYRLLGHTNEFFPAP